MAALRLKLMAWLVLGTLISLLALGLGAWLWSDRDDSLASALDQLRRMLPTGQTLETREVSGSVRAGGNIGWLRWQQGELSIEASEVQVKWSLSELINKELRLSELVIGQLRIEDKRPKNPAPPQPLTGLSLPIKVAAAVRVDHLSWTASTSQSFEKLSFNYVFDSYQHILDKGYIQISSGKYKFSGQLQAQAPMALDFQAGGTLETLIPTSQQPLKVNAQARLGGALAGTDARLTLQATLTPELPPSPKAGSSPAAMQASLSAELAPWHTQPISRAQGQWQALNLAALWPQAPQTLLSGAVTVSPAGQGWQAGVKMVNALSGPWNQQRLPVQTLDAELEFAQGQWLLKKLQAKGAGGNIEASGQFQSGQWQGQAKLQNIDPATIDSRLESVAMSGLVVARQSAGGIAFDASLQAATEKSSAPHQSRAADALKVLRLKSLSARGLWAAPRLTLDALQVHAQDARLQGKLSFDTTSQATQAQLELGLPGLQGRLDGQLASSQGQGALKLELTDAALAIRWLARWPDLATALVGVPSLRGSGQLEARWQGGWQHEAQAMRLDASLRAASLAAVGSASGQPEARPDWHLRDLQADLSGTLAALRLTSRGLLDIGEHKLDWQALAHGGRLKGDAWQASIDQFKIALQNSSQIGPWALQWGEASALAANQPVTLDWRPSGQGNTLTVSAGAARLQGPTPGAASLSWQPIRWTQAAAPAKAQLQRSPGPARRQARWQSRGQISKLPLAWLEAVSSKTLAELGLSSDLLLAGSWDAAQTDRLHLSAMLERSAGDLRLHASDRRQPVLQAGMTEARLQLNLDDGKVSGSLRWDSVRAGRALLAFSTQLQTQGKGWTLANNAPIGASLQMQLPPVEAWSVLAPPGWRLRGTMDANISASGTLDAPQWEGALQARDLAVRSVVDGIDFSGGRLNAHLHGQQLDIQDFTLQGAAAGTGAGAASGGQLSLTGSVFWLGNNAASLPARLRMALEIQAKALRLSSRPDRRVTVSGKVSAQLSDARLTLRGALSADTALITLPDDTAPQLGDDVRVRHPARPASAAQEAAAARAAAAQATSAAKPASARVIPDLQLELDLGPDFQVRGRGLESRLAGKLVLRAKDEGVPSLTGSVRTVRGTYQAYGQKLDIERGVLRFTGPLDNPALAILAIRPKLSQRVGVQISGTALSPIVRLYAEPDLPDADKLAWLVLGHSPSGGGAEAALMQQAALALLGGSGLNLSASLTQALGLDELSFSGGSSNGTASGASVTLGKRLSSDFYLAYERSLNGAVGVFSIFYDLSRHLTLRAQTGEQSAIDLIFTLRYD